MYKKLLAFTVLCIAFIIGTGAFFMHSRESSDDRERELQQNMITINAAQKLIENGEYESAVIKTAELEAALRNSSSEKRGNNDIFVICLVCIGAVMFVSGYVYVKILMPFDKLSGFAENIAKGDFDTPLEYQRSAYFGLFTWAFDNMRSEINKSRACEREAIENNKTVIATLSHDIKTPIASIRAYAEGLEANLDTTPEKRAKYLTILMRKCDEVTKLTNDLFLHALSDLDKLKINTERFKICSYMKNAVSEIAAEQNDVKFTMPDFEVTISADTNRLMQITENLINPLIACLGGTNIDGLSIQLIKGNEATVMNFGAFITAVINFLIMALVVFLIVKAVNKAMNLKKKEEETPTTKVCPYCQSEIDIKATRCPHCTSELEK